MKAHACGGCAADANTAHAPSHAAPFVAALSDATVVGLHASIESLCPFHREKLDIMVRIHREHRLKLGLDPKPGKDGEFLTAIRTDLDRMMGAFMGLIRQFPDRAEDVVQSRMGQAVGLAEMFNLSFEAFLQELRSREDKPSDTAIPYTFPNGRTVALHLTCGKCKGTMTRVETTCRKGGAEHPHVRCVPCDSVVACVQPVEVPRGASQGRGGDA